jgi:capsular exopolysaccharide synthesis family protein
MEASNTISPTASATDSKLHFLDYWRIIRLRKAIILTVFFLVVATVAVVTYFLTPMYASTTGMKVEKDTPDVTVLGFGMQQQGFDVYFFMTEFEVLKSREILERVIRNLKLDGVYAKRLKLPELPVQQAYDLLSRNIEVKQRKNTSIIEITAFDPEKELARNIADEVAKVYEGYREELRAKKLTRGLTTLSNQLAQLDAKVSVATEKVDKQREESGLTDLASESPAFVNLRIQTMQRLDAAKTDLRTQASGMEQLVAKMKSKSGNELRDFLASAAPTPELNSLLGSFNQAEQRRITLLSEVGPAHPDVKRVESLLAKINEQLDQQVSGITASLETQLDAKRRQIADIERQSDETNEKMVADARKAAPYAQAKRDLETAQRTREAMQMELNQQYINAQISKESSVQVIDKARVGNNPVKPAKTLFISAGAVAGLLLGFLLAFFIEYLDTSVKTIDDVEQALGAPVLGVIPQNVGALIREGPDSPHAEAYRVLRTNILFSRKDPDQRTMTVVSGGAGEGKSTTIFNLATIFAQQGSRVLIVDSDLRRPSLHKILDVSNAVGLTNYLLRQMKLEEVVQTTPQAGLDFLPSGKLPSSSVGLLNSQQMKEFIDEVKSRYDFVFFDSPPIMGVSDASILASEVDMAVLVVQYRKYPQQMTLRAKQMVEKIGGKDCLLGVVLNNINISQDSYYYYYSGYYYDYYSKNDESKTDEEKSSGKKGRKSGKGGESASASEVKPKY